MLKALGDEGTEWLVKLLRKVWNKEKIPEAWRKSFLIPVYKQKGDVLECEISRGIKPVEQIMKILGF